MAREEADLREIQKLKIVSGFELGLGQELGSLP